MLGPLRIIDKLKEIRLVYLNQQKEKLNEGNIVEANIYSQVAEDIRLLVEEIKERDE